MHNKYFYNPQEADLVKGVQMANHRTFYPRSERNFLSGILWLWDVYPKIGNNPKCGLLKCHLVTFEIGNENIANFKS